jgi:hypothetical protein
VCVAWKLQKPKKPSERGLEDLVSVGPAIKRQFSQLGIRTVVQLAKRDPEVLYRRLCEQTKMPVDICVLDVYRAAVAQARNPNLPNEQCLWWYWSRVRKSAAGESSKSSRLARSIT